MLIRENFPSNLLKELGSISDLTGGDSRTTRCRGGPTAPPSPSRRAASWAGSLRTRSCPPHPPPPPRGCCPGSARSAGRERTHWKNSNMTRAVPKHLDWAVPFLLLILEPFNVVLQFTGNRLVTRIQMSWLVLAHGGPGHRGRQILLVFSSNSYHLQAKGKVKGIKF